jgi:hypothetical protein
VVLCGCGTWSLTVTTWTGGEENIWDEEGWSDGEGAGLHNEELRHWYTRRQVQIEW